ncbi:uncharacterized protein LOC143146178 isoform X2 [Ptiloglossa arizonensis]
MKTLFRTWTTTGPIAVLGWSIGWSVCFPSTRSRFRARKERDRTFGTLTTGTPNNTSNSTLGYQRNRSTPHASFINVLIRVYPRRSLPTIALVTYISSESLKLLVEILKLFSGINLRGEFLSSRTRNVYRSRKRILIGFRSLLENNHTGELRKKYSGVTEFTLFLENNTSGQEIKYRTSTE